MGGFRDSLKQAVRQIAFRTDLNSLKKQGIEQVSVLGMDRIVGLIEEAVHRYRDTPELRVMLFRSKGRYFSAGADLKQGDGGERSWPTKGSSRRSHRARSSR